MWPADRIHWRIGILARYEFADIAKAKFHFSQAAAKGHADASFQLAEILESEVRCYD